MTQDINFLLEDMLKYIRNQCCRKILFRGQAVKQQETASET